MSPGQEYDPSRHSPYRSQPQHGGHSQPQQLGYGGGYAMHPQHQQWMPPKLRPSGMGMASFVLAVIAGLIAVVFVGAAAYYGDEVDEESPTAIAIGLSMVVGMIMNIVGLVLGIVAVLQRDRKKVFAILGLIFNALILLGVGGLIVVGLTMT